MAGYIDKAPDTNFVDLVEDDDFKRDLVRFFSGGRYKYTKEEMKELGYEGLTKEFVEHMRGQSWNEWTAVKDLNYVRNKDFDQSGKEAFSRLTQAWDNSDKVGGEFLDNVGDFSEAILTAPSTYLGFASFGLGKLAAKGGAKATQLAVRAGLRDAAKRNMAKTGVRRTALQEAKKEAAIGAGTGVTVGGVQSYAQGETREEIKAGATEEDYTYTGKDLIYDAVVGGVTEAAFGGATGYVSGLIGRRRQNNIGDILSERGRAFSEQSQKAAQEAIKTLEGATESQAKAAQTIISDLDDILSARAGVKSSKLRDPLDPERVARGKSILASMSDPNANPEFTSGLSAQTLRGIAAAAVDLQKQLNISPGQDGDVRIAEFVSRSMLGDGAESTFKILDTVKEKYGLSKDEFSLIYLAEASRAGQTLGFLGAISRKGEIRNKDSSIDVLFAKGASSINGVDAKEISAAAVRNSRKGSENAVYSFFQDLDTLRVSLMTSQPQTTVRNLISTGILVGADMSDQVFKAIFKGATGDFSAIRNIIPDTTAILRGMSINKTEAELLRLIMLDEMPETSKRLYSEAMRVEIGMESNSMLAKIGRAANFANTLTDTALKEAIFYGNLDRQFREQGLSLSDWLRSNQKLDNLPEGVSVDAASKEANSMTMQDDFRDVDSVVGNTTRALVRANRKIPFLVSTFAGIPFPRYLGNHIQKMVEYTPVVGEIFHRTNIIQGAGDTPGLTSMLDLSTYDATRTARQATGALMLYGGYELANQRQGEVDYGSIKNTMIQEFGDDADLKPLLGPTMLHMYIGDQLWREENNLPTSYQDKEQFGRDIADVLGGIPEFSFDLGLATGPLLAYITEGNDAAKEELRKQIADFISTYTMNPATALTRDIIGQVSYKQAGAPYTRDLAEGPYDLSLSLEEQGLSTETSMIGEGESTAEMQNRIVRMLPDFLFTQYSQSWNGETDLEYYDFDNPVARGKVDPALKQFSGITAEPPKTSLQKEMSKYNLKNYQLYRTTTANTANVDIVLRKRLAKTMYKTFEDWKKNSPATVGKNGQPGRYGEMTYDEIVADDSIPNEDKKEILRLWITGTIRKEKKNVEDAFDSFVANSPIKARGFIRNNYLFYSKQKGGKRNLDAAAQMINGTTAKEYLAGAETVQDEIEMRLKLLSSVKTLQPLD